MEACGSYPLISIALLYFSLKGGRGIGILIAATPARSLIHAVSTGGSSSSLEHHLIAIRINMSMKTVH